MQDRRVGQHWGKRGARTRYTRLVRVFLRIPRRFPPLRSLIHQSLNISKQRPAQRFPSLSSPSFPETRGRRCEPISLFLKA